MNEQLKQELDKCFKRSAVIYWIEFELSADAILNDPSTLRHADPKVMDAAGWMKKPTTKKEADEIMKQAGWVREEEFLQDLMNRTFEKMKTKDNPEEIKNILSQIKPQP